MRLWEGVKQMTIIDNSAKVESELNKKIERALKAIGKTAVTHAMKQCPVDTSRLKNSINSEITEDELHVGTNVEYAIYVETDDTKKHKAGQKAHFLRDSIANHRDEYKAILKAALLS